MAAADDTNETVTDGVPGVIGADVAAAASVDRVEYFGQYGWS